MALHLALKIGHGMKKRIIKIYLTREVVYNVSHPSLIVFLPDSSVANGTSMIICPGGAWHFLDIENGGYDLARWLNKKGITAFVLKYRLVHVLTDDPVKESMDKYPNDPNSYIKNDENKAVVALANCGW